MANDAIFALIEIKIESYYGKIASDMKGCTREKGGTEFLQAKKNATVDIMDVTQKANSKCKHC